MKSYTMILSFLEKYTKIELNAELLFLLFVLSFNTSKSPCQGTLFYINILKKY